MSEDEADKAAYELSENASSIFADMAESEVICKLPMYLYKRTK